MIAERKLQAIQLLTLGQEPMLQLTILKGRTDWRNFGRRQIVTFFTVCSLNCDEFQPSSGHDEVIGNNQESKVMNRLLLWFPATLACGLSLAEEQGRVISATPVFQQVTVPRQVCSTEQVAVQPGKSGAGAVMGAIAGGAVGNAVGGGTGKTAATMLGIIGGAVVGNNIEGAPPTQMQDVQHCRTQNFYENRTVAYNVAYEYAGKHYSLQMPYDPGPTIALQITPVISNPNMAPASAFVYPQR